MKPMDETFKIYGEVELNEPQMAKSGQTAPEEDPYIIKGRVLNSVKDHQGETPIIKDMDWSFFDKEGWVKYEHDPMEATIEGNKTIVKSVPDPSNHIGIPVSRTTHKNGKEEQIIVSLLKGVDKADSSVKLMKALREHNLKFPNKKRTIGFSIEGKYLKKSATGHYAGKVINVALTPQPQDATTYAEFATEQNLAMAKSLNAGYGTSPDIKVDGGALRPESLDKSPKHNHQGGKKMNFTTKKECAEYHKSAGKTEAEAKTLAEQYFQEAHDKRNAGATEVEKSVNAGLQSFLKSIEILNAFGTSLTAKSAEIAACDVEIKKSLTDVTDKKEIDGVKFLIEHDKTISVLASIVTDTATAISKSMIEMMNGISKIGESQTILAKSVVTNQSDTHAFIENLADRVVLLKKSIQKSDAGISIENLDAEKVADTVKLTDKKEILKSLNKKAVEKYLADEGEKFAQFGKEEDLMKATAYFHAHDAFRVGGYADLNKSMVTEIAEHFAKK